MIQADPKRSSDSPMRSAFVGVEAKVPVFGGGQATYINLDNAASTPPLRSVQEGVAEFAEWYSSVHRGSGYKSRLSTQAYEEARSVIRAFVNADPSQTVVFVKNTTEAANLVARKLAASSGDGLVVSTLLEHHSNLLPWRHRNEQILVRPAPDGRVDLEALNDALRKHAGKVALVAITGASNVSGYIPPIHQIAEVAHSVGARIFVDAAQLAPHHPLDVRAADDPGHLDFVAFSAHKMYAPYGSGALVGAREFFESAEPDLVGGGGVSIVTETETVWNRAPDRDEAGSPNVIGAVALAIAVATIEGMGLDTIIEHERALTRQFIDGLSALDGARIYGPCASSDLSDQLGIVTFNLAGHHNHQLTAAALSWEWGIGVRSGCFCAHPYLLHLLDLDPGAIASARNSIVEGSHAAVPGAVRASFAPYNTAEEVDVLIEACSAIAKGKLDDEYQQDTVTGAYAPAGGWPAMPSIFDMARMEQPRSLSSRNVGSADASNPCGI